MLNTKHKFYLIHPNWSGYVIANFLNSRVLHEDSKQTGSFLMNNQNEIFISWDQFDAERFLQKSDGNFYYKNI